MAVTIGIRREFEIIGNDASNDACIFPRDFRESTCAQAFSFNTKKIASQSDRYLAFPFVIKLGASLVGIYSDGESHAASDKQVMIRSDDNGVTWSSVDFYVAATNTFNFSLISELLSSGQTAVLKVWTVKNTGGVFSATTNATVSYGGLTYSLWSRAVNGPSGKLYRTGYGANGADTQTALFESSDGGMTWVGKAVMFATPGLLYSESDITNTSGTNWLAVVREDSGAANPLYVAYSGDDGATWSAPVLIPTANANGRQPNLTKTTDGSVILATGDRSGVSGYASSGDQVAQIDTTGIALFRSQSTALGNNPLTTVSAGSTAVRVTHVSHGLATGDKILLTGVGAVLDGIPAAQLNGIKSITVISSLLYEFNVTTPAVTGGVIGGGAAVSERSVSNWGFRTRVSPMYSTDGGQPFVNEVSDNRICAVYYVRQSLKKLPVISSATLNIGPM